MTETEAKWSDRIQRWKQSGQKAADFAAGQPYKPSTLVWWATELRRREQGLERQATATTRKVAMAQVVTRPRVGSPTPAASLVVEISGARITLHQGFDTELFGQVVRALGGQR